MQLDFMLNPAKQFSFCYYKHCLATLNILSSAIRRNALVNGKIQFKEKRLTWT